MSKSRVSWSQKDGKKVFAQDCDEIHVTDETLTVFHNDEKKVINLMGIKDVTFYPKSSRKL